MQGIGLKIFIIFHLKSKIQIFPIYEGLKFELIRITFEDTHIYFLYIAVTIKFDEIKRDSINHFKDIKQKQNVFPLYIYYYYYILFSYLFSYHILQFSFILTIRDS